MNRTYIIGGLVLMVLVGAVGLLSPIMGQQDATADTFDQARIQSCESTKQTMCQTADTVTEEDYPDSCFSNGEHILEQPYTC